MKKLFTFLFLLISFSTFAQTEWTPKYYTKGDTVKVGSVVYVANRSFNSASHPPNSYWTLVSGQPAPTNETVKTYSVDVSVNWQPISDSLKLLDAKIKALGTGTSQPYDLTEIQEDINLLKLEVDNLVFLPDIQNQLAQRLEALEVAFSQLQTKHSTDISTLNDRINNLPTSGTGTVNVSGLPYSAASLGLFPGSDITDKLNAYCTGKTIVFDAGNYIILGKINGAGTNFVINKGSKIVGTGALDNIYITAGDYHIFDTTLNFTNTRTTGDRVWWSWFGATPNNPNDDDRAALQKGIDMVIANPSLPRSFFGSSGYYHIDKGLVVYKWDGIDYRFCDITIQGEPDSWKNSEEYGTWIWQRNPQSFGINFQRVRSSGVRDVNFRGQAMFENHYGSYDKLFASNFDTYTQDYNTAQGKNILDGRFAMHAAIIVDGFANGPLYNGTWPGFESWNRGTQQTGGSSGFTASGVYLYGWVVGISYSPSATTYNAEHCYAEKLFMRSLKVGVSVGQDQNKNIPVTEFEAYNIHTVFDGRTYGKGIGAHVFASKASMSNCYRMVNISSQRFSSSFRDMITEEFKEIGFIEHGGQPTLFENCQIEIIGNSERASTVSKSVLTGNNIRFTGGYIRTPHAPTFTRLFFNGRDITFHQTTLETPPLFPGTVETTNGNANGYFQSVNLLAWESRLGATSVSSQNLEPFRNYPLFGDFTISSQMIYPGASVKISYNETKYDFSYRLGGGDLSNIIKGTADFKIQHPNVYPLTGVDVNDHLITDLNGSIQAIGRVTSVNHATGEIKLTDVPDNLVPGNYITWGNYIRRVQRPFIGDVTANSNKIENIRSPFGLPSVGDRIETYVDFSNNSVPIYIISVDGTTATTSRPMLHSSQNVNFAMGDPVISVLSIDAYDKTIKIFLNGTEFKTKK